MNITDRPILDFLDNEYKEYATYVLEKRALPSVVDGCKPTARKIIHSALKSLKPGKKEKMLNLIGEVYKQTAYEHGNSSLESGIVGLGSAYKDNFAPLEIVGSSGSLRSYDASAPRYLSVKLSKYAELYKHDSDILEYNYDGDQCLEPKYYLPIIPMVLASRASGIALGYAFKNPVSYNPIDLVDACLSVLDKQPLAELTPHVIEYDGKWVKTKDKRIQSVADVEYTKNTITVRSLPVSQTFESFESNLNRLQDNDTIIKWDNNSEDEDTEYVIHINPEKLEKIRSRNLQNRIFKIGEFMHKPTLYMLNEHNKVIHFNNIQELIAYFTEFRLTKYSDLKRTKLKAMKDKLASVSMVRNFIDLYLSGTIKLSKDVPLSETKKLLKQHRIDESVLRISISKLTKDEYDKLTNEISDIEKKIEYMKATKPVDIYRNDLNSFKNSIRADFPYQRYEIQ